MPRVEHRSHKGLNNRAENSHVPLRKRERMGIVTLMGVRRNLDPEEVRFQAACGASVIWAHVSNAAPRALR
jgi:hypothetical protein